MSTLLNPVDEANTKDALAIAWASTIPIRNRLEWLGAFKPSTTMVAALFKDSYHMKTPGWFAVLVGKVLCNKSTIACQLETLANIEYLREKRLVSPKPKALGQYDLLLKLPKDLARCCANLPGRVLPDIKVGQKLDDHDIWLLSGKQQGLSRALELFYIPVQKEHSGYRIEISLVPKLEKFYFVENF